MKISYLTILAAVFGLLAPHALHAQSGGQQRVISTIDSKALNAELILVGRVVSVTGTKNTADAVIAVDETLKGDARNPHLLHVSDNSDSRDLKDTFKKNKSARLLVIGNTFTSLSSKDLRVPTASGPTLHEPDEVIEYVREVIRTHPGVNRIATYTLRGRIVPLDARTEAWAIDDIRAGRTEGLDILKSFQSPQNIALLRGFLADPRFGTLSAEFNHGIEVRTYDIRRKAYETLKAWSVDVASPVLREEISKLDTMERLSWRGPVDTAVFQKLAEAKKLKSLEFSGNDLSDTQMALVGRITSLTHLKVGDQITDAGLKELRGLTNLQDLNLNTSRITDKGLAELAALPNLKNLTLLETRVSDEGLQTLVQFPSLKFVDVTLTRMTKEGVAEARRLHPSVGIVDTSYYFTQDYLATHVFQGDVDQVRGDLEWHKIDPNRITHGTPAIFYAISQNHIKIVRMLLDHKARADIVDDGNSTPLQWAVRYGYIPIMKLLLDRGANVNHTDSESNTALHLAAQKRTSDTIHLLLASGALISARNREGLTPVDVARKYRNSAAENEILKFASETQSRR